MAIYKIFPVKDATIYSQIPTGNAGKDEILEIASYPYQGNGKTARTLIQFDNTEVASVVDTNIGNTNFSASLKLYLAYASELPAEYTVEAYPVYDSWVNGTGKFGDVPINTSGVSWNTSDGSATWNLDATNVTSSYQAALPGGGSWYTGSLGFDLFTSQSHNQASTYDLDIDVTQAAKLHYSQSKGLDGIENNGFLLKFPSDIEFEATSSIRLRYFGVDTHTIYPPSLEIKWDDSTFNTGSSSQTIISDVDAIFTVTNNRGRFTDDEKYRFRIGVKPKYPVRTFSTSSNYLTNYYLPTASYWGIRDEHTEEMVFDFDTNFTKISADQNSSYFDVYMGGLEPERYYRVLLKTTIDGSSVVLDENITFKVVRNG